MPWVMPLRNESAKYSPWVYAKTSMSGAFAAITNVAVANGVARSAPAFAMVAPTRAWVRLSRRQPPLRSAAQAVDGFLGFTEPGQARVCLFPSGQEGAVRVQGLLVLADGFVGFAEVELRLAPRVVVA